MSIGKLFVILIIGTFLYNNVPEFLNSLTRDKIPVHDLPIQGDLIGYLKDNSTILLYDPKQPTPFAFYNSTQDKISRFSIEKFLVNGKETLDSPIFEKSPVWGMGYGGTWCIDKNDSLLINSSLDNMSKEAREKMRLNPRERRILQLNLKEKMGAFINVGKTVYTERSAPIFLDALECHFYIEKKDAESTCSKNYEYLKCLDHIAFTETPPEGTNSKMHGVIAKNILTGYFISGRTKANLVDKHGKSREVPVEPFLPHEQSFYDAGTETTYHYSSNLSAKAWPLKVRAFDENGDLKERISLPMPPFVGNEGIESMKYLAAGPDTYRDLNLSHINNTFFAVVTGTSVVNGAQGIYALKEQKWEKIAKIEKNSRYLFSSPDQCKVVWLEWEDKEEPRKKAITHNKYANICDTFQK